jgi:hypothetical protein
MKPRNMESEYKLYASIFSSLDKIIYSLYPSFSDEKIISLNTDLDLLQNMSERNFDLEMSKLYEILNLKLLFLDKVQKNQGSIPPDDEQKKNQIAEIKEAFLSVPQKMGMRFIFPYGVRNLDFPSIIRGASFSVNGIPQCESSNGCYLNFRAVKLGSFTMTEKRKIPNDEHNIQVLAVELTFLESDPQLRLLQLGIQGLDLSNLTLDFLFGIKRAIAGASIHLPITFPTESRKFCYAERRREKRKAQKEQKERERLAGSSEEAKEGEALQNKHRFFGITPAASPPSVSSSLSPSSSSSSLQTKL